MMTTSSPISAELEHAQNSEEHVGGKEIDRSG